MQELQPSRSACTDKHIHVDAECANGKLSEGTTPGNTAVGSNGVV